MKPCWNCGGEAITLRKELDLVYGRNMFGNHRYYYQCEDCGYHTLPFADGRKIDRIITPAEAKAKALLHWEQNWTKEKARSQLIIEWLEQTQHIYFTRPEKYRPKNF